MLFNSYVFILAFLPIVLFGYFGLNRLKKYQMAKVFLILASLFFYGYFNWTYLLIIILSVIINYFFSQIMLNNTNTIVRKSVFAFSLIANIGSLFFFKYYDFFIGNVNSLFGSSIPLLNIALPLGISFFTFQQLSYVIDSYTIDKNISTYNFWDYTLFVTYFPQLIAGPIVTHDEMAPQFADLSKKKFNSKNFAVGLYGFTLGLAKKVLIADALGLLVDATFVDIGDIGTIGALIVMLSYTFQIYFDFSGYCDMATGIGKMMNIDITMNFNSPYKALSVVDFWKRWHMTLTRFFTKYIYIPLGGNRKGEARTYVNIMIVYLVSGIWHGANWTFILWGVLHGLFSVITRVVDKHTGLFSEPRKKWVTVLLWFGTFIFINMTWIIFRANSFEQVSEFYQQLFSMNFSVDTSILSKIWNDGFSLLSKIIPYANKLFPVTLLAFAMVASVFMKNTNERMMNFKPTITKAVSTSIILVWCIMSFAGVSSFLYWNF